MAKRTNPFIDDFIPQSKIHVGLKQFNNNDEKCLNKVYEKTLVLLFKGAKKFTVQDVNKSEIISTGKDKMKQLFIDKNGALQHSGSMVKEKIVLKQCNCGSTMESQCAYCEVTLCDMCQHTCVRCETPYCTKCTLMGSEGSAVCVSCYS